MERKYEIFLNGVVEEINSKLEEMNSPYRAIMGEKLYTNGEKLPTIGIGDTFGLVRTITADVMEALIYNRKEVIEDMVNTAIARHGEIDWARFQSALDGELVIRPKLISRERNKELVLNCPHRDILDLSLVYERKLPEVKEGMVAILKVTNDFLWTKDMSEEDIYSLSEEYVEDYSLTSHRELVEEMTEDEKFIVLNLPEEDVFYILSIDKDTADCGAAVLGYPKILKEVSERMEGSYYIFPSSIHEVLVLSSRTGMSERHLKGMVKEANLNLPEDEFLSDNLYFYNAETEEISIVE